MTGMLAVWAQSLFAAYSHRAWINGTEKLEGAGLWMEDRHRERDKNL